MITGWRSGDPLRRMLVHPRSGITAAHIAAADMLREQVDLATMGYSSARPLIFIASVPLPRFGLSPAALAMVRACRVVARVVKLFSRSELHLLQAVVLANVTLHAWTAHFDPPASPAVEKRKLLGILDKLVAHFDAEVQDDLARGRRLPP